MLRTTAISISLLTIPMICVSEPMPVDFIAGITAFAEICASRYPAMRDAPEKLLKNMSEDDKGFVAQVKQSTTYGAALIKARIQVSELSSVKIENECKAMYR